MQNFQHKQPRKGLILIPAQIPAQTPTQVRDQAAPILRIPTQEIEIRKDIRKGDLPRQAAATDKRREKEMTKTQVLRLDHKNTNKEDEGSQVKALSNQGLDKGLTLHPIEIMY